jgi:hypothetical protein
MVVSDTECRAQHQDMRSRFCLGSVPKGGRPLGGHVIVSDQKAWPGRVRPLLAQSLAQPTVLDCGDGCLRAIRNIQFAHGVEHVFFGGFQSHVNRAGDLLVA